MQEEVLICRSRKTFKITFSLDFAVAEIEEEVECRVDGDQEVVRVNQNRKPLKK